MRSPLASPFRGGWRNLTPMRGRGRGGANPWTPAMLPPYAWYDAELGQPKYAGYVQLNGVSGDNISTPDSVALSFSGDIEVVMRVKVNNWSTGATQTLACKYITGTNQRSWRAYVSSSGQIAVSVSTDGTATNLITTIVTPTVPLPNNTWIWLRIRLDLTNGTNSVGTLETAADIGNNAEPSSWTANGPPSLAASIAGVFDSSAPLEIGSFADGASERLSGRVGRCIVRSGFGGAVVADFNADDCYGDGYTHTDGYRWTLGIPKIYDRSGNNHPPAVFGAGSNQPLWLPWTGTPSVYLTGVTGNYVSCPDAAPLDITGDLEIVARVALDDWTPAAESVLVDKYITTGNQRGYRFVVTTTGALRLYTSSDGAAGTLTATSTTSIGATDGTAYWVKVTLDVDNGASGNDAKFFWAADQTAEPTSWTQLGSTVTTAGVTSIFANTAILEIGATAAGAAAVLAGRVHQAILRDGIDGTTVADFDAALCGQSGYTDAQGNPWTVSRSTSGRKTVVQSHAANSARSVILHGTDDYIDVPAAAVPTLGASDPLSVNMAGRQWGTPTNFGRLFSLGQTGVTERIQILHYTSSPYLYSVTHDGTVTVQGGGPVLTFGQRFVRTVSMAAPRSATGHRDRLNAASTALNNSTLGALVFNVARIGAASTSLTSFQDFEFESLSVLNRVLTDAEHAQLVAYYGGGL